MSKSKAIQTTRPQTRQEFMTKLQVPYDESQGKSGGVFSEPKKQGQPEANRAYEVSQKNDTDTNIAIGIKDIDEAIKYYFKNVLKLSVVQNNQRLEVPILYGSPENWASVQKDGYYRDKNGKLMAPLLMFKRSNIRQNRTLGNKIDGKSNQNIQIFEKQFSNRNVYNSFSALTSREPEKVYTLSITPDYVTIQYECIVWTYFIEQMDKLIEALNFESRKYWGDPSKFQFYTDIESFTDSISYDVGEDRAIKCTFSMTINGYLIPNVVNKEILSAQRAYGVSKVVFNSEVVTKI